MDYAYAEKKLTALLLDLSNYTADEFRRQMARIITGATGQDVPDYCHAIKAERDALAKEVDAANDRNAELVELRDALAAQVKAVTARAKELAHDAYWEASDSNRADRWADNFDESVRAQFEKYWSLNNQDELLPERCIAEIRAEAGRAGYEYGALQWCFNSSDMSADIEKSADVYSNWILKGANPLAAVKVRQGGE